MGCSGSKAQDLPLVVRCRQRRELIRAASNYRYALAAAHVSYFRSLKDVGDSLRKFVDEDLVTASISSSVSSPSLILPSTSKKKKDNNADKLQLNDSEDEDESHLYLSDSSSSSNVKEDGGPEYFKHQHHNHYALDSEDESHQHHTHHAHHEHRGKNYYSSHNPRGGFDGYRQTFGDGFINDPYVYPHSYSYQPNSFGEPYMDQWNQPGVRPPLQPWYFSSNSNVYYMNKAAPEMKTVVREPPPEPSYGYMDSYWNSPADDSGNYGYFTWGSTARMKSNDGSRVSPQKEAPPPPPPEASGWDFFNPFDVSDYVYQGYYFSGGFGYGLNNNSPDSSELREREGIPDLEEDTENEVSKEFKGNRMKTEARQNKGASFTSSVAVPARKNRDSRSAPPGKSEGSSRSVPLGKSESSSRSVPLGEREVSSRSVPLREREGISGSAHSRKTEVSSSRSVASWGSEKSSMPSNSAENVKPSMPSPLPYIEESLKSSVPTQKGTSSWVNLSPSNSISLTDGLSSSETIFSKSVDEASVRKKGVSFEVEEMSNQDADSSKLSSVTISSPHGTRDLHDVVAEIRDDFEIASSFGKEVANLLEVGKLPHHSGLLKVILSRVIRHSTHSTRSPSAKSVKLASRTIKLAKSYFEDVGKDANANANACDLSSTLDKLYAWERKLYKEVKDEEGLRVLYEKQCKRLKILDEGGAESSKLEAARASIGKLLTKLEVSIKAIDAISSRIHKLRDEELQPQIAALVHGLIRMWKAMLKCHQKQFKSIMDSKMRKLKANTGLKNDSSSRATTELERELRLWCERFIDWITFQKSYIKSLNGWLLQCVQYEPEETPDGPVPYSPGQLGAPPIFIICNDWHQAMESISEARVTNALNTLVTRLRQLGEKQDEEGRQRLKAEYLSKDFEKHLRSHRMTMYDQTGMPLVPSNEFDDRKVDLDSMRRKLAEERIKHKDTKKSVNDAASGSLQGGLVPIFKALENFTSDALKLHEHVRLKHPGP